MGHYSNAVLMLTLYAGAGCLFFVRLLLYSAPTQCAILQIEAEQTFTFC